MEEWSAYWIIVKRNPYPVCRQADDSTKPNLSRFLLAKNPVDESIKLSFAQQITHLTESLQDLVGATPWRFESSFRHRTINDLVNQPGILRLQVDCFVHH